MTLRLAEAAEEKERERMEGEWGRGGQNRQEVEQNLQKVNEKLAAPNSFHVFFKRLQNISESKKKKNTKQKGKKNSSGIRWELDAGTSSQSQLCSKCSVCRGNPGDDFYILQKKRERKKNNCQIRPSCKLQPGLSAAPPSYSSSEATTATVLLFCATSHFRDFYVNMLCFFKYIILIIICGAEHLRKIRQFSLPTDKNRTKVQRQNFALMTVTVMQVEFQLAF